MTSDVRLAVGVGRDVEPEQSVEGERRRHVGDDEADEVEGDSHGSNLERPPPDVLNESDSRRFLLWPVSLWPANW